MRPENSERMGQAPQSTGCKVSEQYLKRATTGRTGMLCKFGYRIFAHSEIMATKKTLDGPAIVIQSEQAL